ncbi:outer membrane receptor for ferrienterochelin and colicins [Aquimarina sp. MAR_2010_214]|uniref:TonB-dependent receptor plug domain-containing protein n=1 Tax=Aquimarina sp. MAR_2010_214 TaxID=1250026 RepID=UPI000C70E252|nr:TonB-dependent receptor [Aquimarina sp. MAR_2010_214]PKV48247.1 outer membrane receptor for ferrienterochelin and colicins [Aquimarina sp. MAR_2010_214]
MKIESLIIWVLTSFVIINGYSQGKAIDTTMVNELQEVVLTATRTERQLSSLPLPVTIVSQEIIKQSGTIRLNEILNEQTGIITVADESGFEGVQIQGITSDYILILIDGVPLVGRKAGNFDVNRLTVGNIKQVEVVKGPSSSLYGSDALGGVINIITEKPKSDVLSGNASYRIGSYTQQDINVDIKQCIKKFGYGVFANRFSSEGYDLNPDTAGQTVNPFENYTFNGRLYYDFSDQFSLFLSGRLYTQYQDAGFIANTMSFEGDSEEQEWNGHLRLDHKWSDHLATQYELYYTNYNAKEQLLDEASGDTVSDSDFDQRLLRPEIRTTYTFRNRSKLTTGIGFQYDQLDRTFFDKQVDFNSQYAYAQYDLNLIERLNIIAGVRFDNHSEYSNQFSPKLALRYKITAALAAKASIGYGFKAPDFRQLYFDFTNSAVGYTILGYNVALEKLNELQAQGQILDVVVPESSLQDPLEAESSIGYNIGLTYKKKQWNAELNLFRNDFKNLIDTRVIARKTNGQNVFSYFNFDKIYTTGLELNTNYRITDNVRLSAGYQLLYAFDKEKEKQVKNDEVFARDPETNQTVLVSRSEYFGLVNRSRHNANFKVFYDIVSANANINLRLLYRSKYALFDTNGNDLIDDYDTSFVDGFVTTNIAASKTFYEKFTLQIGANNLFDYTEENIPTLPGIQLYAKLNYQF